MPAQSHALWLNTEVVYISGSGKRYMAIITAIPENPDHAYSTLPTVTLEFVNTRSNTVCKTRAIPYSPQHGLTTKCWYPVSPAGHFG